MQSGARKRLQAPAGAIVTGQVYQVLGTYDGTTQRLYINGSEVASAPLTGAVTANDNALDIGSWNEGTEPFNGTVDEVSVYAGALSAARVLAQYQAGTSVSKSVALRSGSYSPTSPPTFGYYCHLHVLVAAQTSTPISWPRPRS
jgi:hypothetical protein